MEKERVDLLILAPVLSPETPGMDHVFVFEIERI
jgi:hypothetical protein